MQANPQRPNAMSSRRQRKKQNKLKHELDFLERDIQQ